ncbi:hypothetical protein [uncultured Kordia sp.]|uniref:hypothetical protein n=1 Tax=uncultured Kordia sp. TaxID=507699 RepID=UPI00262DE406|nr:hypothetical protein [uncultured Kordia sp.]
MKEKFFLIFITLSVFQFSLCAQTQQTVIVDTTKVTDLKFYAIENYNFPFKITNTQASVFNFNSNDIKQSYFQKYNSISMLTDFYEQSNNSTYTYVNSSRSLENMYRGVKIDSYNPRGMSPNATSVLFGVFGVIFEKIQNN